MRGWTFHAWPAAQGFLVGIDAAALGKRLAELGAKKPIDAVVAELSTGKEWSSHAEGDAWWLSPNDALEVAVTTGGTKAARLVVELTTAYAEALGAVARFVEGLQHPSVPRTVDASPRGPATSPRGDTGIKPTRAEILAALHQVNYHMARAAAVVGLPLRTFYRRMEAHGIPLKRAAQEAALGGSPAPSKHDA